MKPLSFIIVGSGFRAMFYGRIAGRYPELFALNYILCRSADKAGRIHAETGFPVTISAEDCRASKPDFVVVAVNKGNIADIAEEWAMMGYPVLMETPAGCSFDQLKRIWELKEKYHCKIQVCEQYFHCPTLKAGINHIKNGAIGRPHSMYLSLVHEYHAASLIRKYLLIDHEKFTVSGKQFVFPLTETDSRQGAVTDGSVASYQRTAALFEFASGKMAVYDFSGEQYRSFIRSRHVTVRGRNGELTDQILYRITEERYPQTTYLMPELEPRYHILETKRLRDCVRSWTPELYLDEIEDEYAIACMLYDMREYLDSGKEIYPLRDALQDSYMALLLQEACTSGRREVCSEPMPWN